METILKLSEKEKETVKEVSKYCIAYQQDYSEVKPTVLFAIVEDLLNEIECWKEKYEDLKSYDEESAKEEYEYQSIQDAALEREISNE